MLSSPSISRFYVCLTFYSAACKTAGSVFVLLDFDVLLGFSTKGSLLMLFYGGANTFIYDSSVFFCSTSLSLYIMLFYLCVSSLFWLMCDYFFYYSPMLISGDTYWDCCGIGYGWVCGVSLGLVVLVILG